ncbi:MAG: branched-chain amino acid ABC transporter permease [Thermomicrobiales bacterium]
MATVTLPVVFEQLVSGLAIGGVYALVALGFALIFGVMRVAQFAHGEVAMLGAFLALALLPALPAVGGARFALALAAALLLGAMVGAVIERTVFRPLTGSPAVAPIIAAVGLSILLQYLAADLWGAEFHSFALGWYPGNLTLGWVSLPVFKVIILGAALGLLAALHLLLTRSRLGRAIRATAADAETAQLMGVDTARTTAVTFAIGSALAGAAGVLVAGLYGVAYSSMGVPMLVKGYTATVIGGLGSLTGAVAGGLLLGVTEFMLESYGSPRWSDTIVFALLIALLVLRPHGLLGQVAPERL